MIEGTREYKRKQNSSPLVDEKSAPADNGAGGGTNVPVERASNSAEEAKGAAHAPEAARCTEALDRRAWFSSLVPALGDGLVKILRASNNLKDDLGLRR